jgi:hypothetical protein
VNLDISALIFSGGGKLAHPENTAENTVNPRNMEIAQFCNNCSFTPFFTVYLRRITFYFSVLVRVPIGLK